MPRFIKDPKDIESITKVVETYFDLLKSEHIWLASTSIFPATSLNAFTSYSRKAKFHDKVINQSMLDTLFIAVNVDLEEEAGGENPDAALIRYEFIELLVRIAKEKFFKTHTCKTMAESLEMLLQRHIMPVSVMDQW